MSGVNASYPFIDYLGTPIYTSKGFLGPHPALLDDHALRGICIDYVRTHGREDFFRSKNWEGQLRQVVREFYKNNKLIPRWEGREEQKERMIENLKSAKEGIENRLKNKTVQHLAYPWGEGSETAIWCSKETGYISNFWATLPHFSKNKKGSDPYKLVRLKHDFIWRLPGSGRKSLKIILITKRFWKRSAAPKNGWSARLNRILLHV